MKKIKLILKGKKKVPSFQLVIMDSHRSPKSKYLTKLGVYIPKEELLLIKNNYLLQNLKLGTVLTKNVKTLCLFQLKFNLDNYTLIN